MTTLLSAPLNLNGVDPDTGGGAWTPVPAGNYNAMCTELEVTTGQNSKGVYEMLKATFQILDGPQKGKTFRDNLIFRHSGSEDATNIGQKRLRSWCDAVGADLNLTDLNVLTMKPITVGVRVDPPRVSNGKEYSASNRVTTISAPGNSTAAPVSPPVARPTASAAPAVAAPAPQPAAAAPAPAGALPWQR